MTKDEFAALKVGDRVEVRRADNNEADDRSRSGWLPAKVVDPALCSTAQRWGVRFDDGSWDGYVWYASADNIRPSPVAMFGLGVPKAADGFVATPEMLTPPEYPGRAGVEIVAREVLHHLLPIGVTPPRLVWGDDEKAIDVVPKLEYELARVKVATLETENAALRASLEEAVRTIAEKSAYSDRQRAALQLVYSAALGREAESSASEDAMKAVTAITCIRAVFATLKPKTEAKAEPNYFAENPAMTSRNGR